MTEAFYRVAYFSRNAIDGNAGELAAEVDSILEVSRRNNIRANLTGALLFNSSCFAQVLEGPLTAMERTFERIQRDSRHADVTVLELGPADGPEFAGWSMAFAGRIEEHRLNFSSFAQQIPNRLSTVAEELHTLLHGLLIREETAR